MIDQRANRLITSLDTQIARVEIVVGHSNERLRRKSGIQAERMNRSLLTGRIAIEGEHDTRTQRLSFNLQRTNQLYRTQRIVGDQTTHDLGMLGTERGAACRDRGINAGQMHGHHIRIPFDDHRLTFLHNRRLRHINAIQHLVFPIQLRVGSINVFRTNRIILIQLASAETKRASG